MPDFTSTMIAIIMMGLIVYACRITGYLVGIQFSGIDKYRTILEALPGCALAVVLAPAAMNGAPHEIAALAATMIMMWFTGSVPVSTLLGLAILLAGGYYLV